MENQEKNETTVLPENPEIMVKNPRIGKVRKLEEEVRRQNELEQLRTKRIRNGGIIDYAATTVWTDALYDAGSPLYFLLFQKNAVSVWCDTGAVLCI